MNIAIIGAGWFGCHIATSLIAHNHDVVIFEKQSDVFEKASTFNTGRLHQGFHHPRSYATRKECTRNFKRFIKIYGDLCEKVKNNFYLVANKKSLLDFDTYQQILKASNLNFKKINPEKYGFENIEGGVLCDEYAVNPIKAKEYFKNTLKDYFRFNYQVEELNQSLQNVKIENETFDLVINASYLNFTPFKITYPIVYENIISLLLEPNDKFLEKSFVIMDGNFSSLNRFYQDNNQNIYSLYHVKHSVLNISTNFEGVQKKHNELITMPNDEYNFIKEEFINEMCKYYPAFNEEFNVIGKFLTIRTKLDNMNADRSCYIVKNNRVIDILSGKINSIFEAEDYVLSVVNDFEMGIVNK